MIFIGIALLVAAGLAIAVGADAGSLVGLTQDQAGHALPLLLVLIVVFAGVFSRRRPAAELLTGLALWIGIFAVAITGFAYRDDIMNVANRVYGELSPGQPVVDRKTGIVSFQRGLGGHFEVSARINGAKVPLIFDTGASAMVLTASDARKAGIDTSRLTFDTPVSTANGTGRAAVVYLDRIDIGGIVRRNVRTYIAQDHALDTSLLGMTFLETLSRYSVTKDSLELSN
ncbi:MAG TPA: TIGR02281 family clan AA aspartic protease [Devosiaceae bacterium]|nr:TIGR02281 family clan AA aspartic protease [Devosiaceae bacterium]